MVAEPDWTLSDHVWSFLDQVWLCLPTLILLLPLVIFDIVRLSNRFAGPIYRLRKHLSELSQDSQTSPLNFRDDDYWQQLAEPINLLQQKLLVLEQQVQTLSFVHQQLQEGTVPADVTQVPEPAANSPKETPVDEQVASVSPTIPPLPGNATDAFVTLEAR